MTDPQFADAFADRLHITGIAVAQSPNPLKDSLLCLQVAKPCEPLVELIRDFD
jgi:hypothetical protein